MIIEEIDKFDKKSSLNFKNTIFQQKFRPISNSGKKKVWKSLKQLVAQDRILVWPSEIMHYSSINSSTNCKPSKKYSDISGLLANYIDPHTKLYYANVDEFITIRNLPMDITAGYLALRGASNIVG